MSLTVGTRLGPYEILSLLGSGGMGDVYKAHDTRLDRVVALKTLRAHLADNPELKDRFEREARTVAGLQHEHICVLYDIRKDAPVMQGGGPQNSIDYLVLEYLEGETLANRLLKGPLPLAQVLQFSIEISDALDKAHRKGVTHRDIKPGNVMLVKSGSGYSTKLLDFGLAKLKQAAPKEIPLGPDDPTPPLGIKPGVQPAHAQKSPTAFGTIMGTFQYMSPEQAEGKNDTLDARSDIFSFGAMLYEMVTGRKAFEGKTQISLVSAILKDEPPAMSKLQPVTPPALDRVVKQCLAKEPDERWQTASDLCRELQWIKEGGGQTAVSATVVAPRNRRERLAWAVGAIGLIVATVAMAFTFFHRASAARPVRLNVNLPEKVTLDANPYSVSVSPDGLRLAFVAVDASGKRLLYIRELDSLSAQPLEGTDGAADPFWSPDSRFIAFFAQGKLNKFAISGGPPQTLAAAPLTYWGGAWNREGVILFTPNAPQGGLYRVPATGGTPVPVTALDTARQQDGHAFPQFLPDGKHFLYLGRSQNPANTAIYAGSLDSKESKLILAATSNVYYSPPGYLLFHRDGTLMAQPFDASRLELTGEPSPIAEKVQFGGNIGNVGRANFSASQNGILVYRTGSGGSGQYHWLDRAGKELAVVGEVNDYNTHFSLSPDEKRVSMIMTTPQGTDLWLLDLSRGTTSRFAFPLLGSGLVWSANSDRLIFRTATGGVEGIYQKLSSGAGQEELLINTPGSNATDLSRDGRFLLYDQADPKTNLDLWVLTLSGERKPSLFLRTEFNESQGKFSPDGRWVAYDSDESGQMEIYVQPFPGPGPKWQVSTNGGTLPRWRQDGKELFYLNQGKLMSVEVKAGAQFEAGAPRLLFEPRVGMTHPPGEGYHYAVSGDGGKFLVLKPKEETQSFITVVLNWTAGLKKP